MRGENLNKNILAETDKLVIIHHYEEVCLIDKTTQKKIFCTEFYGEPQAALVSPKNDWALIGGEDLMLWKGDGKILEVSHGDLKWIHDLRLKNKSIYLLPR